MSSYLCTENGEINIDGSNLIDERFDSANVKFVKKTCPNFQKCCNKVDFVSKNSTKARESREAFETPKKCGFRNLNGLGGTFTSLQNPTSTNYAQYAEFPWMMAVLVDRAGELAYKCGGSLIHPRVVLTTAHNSAGVDPKKLVVRGGEYDTQTEDEMVQHEEKKVARVIRHDKFVRNNLQNDIALLLLKNEFQLTPFINTICLPPMGTSFVGKKCIASGWGSDKFGKKNIFQVFLKKIELPIVPNPTCQTFLRTTVLGEDYELHEGLLCAGKIYF